MVFFFTQPEQIASEYRVRAKRYHPDRAAAQSEYEQQLGRITDLQYLV